ncbi:hypothetical protein ABFX02_09G056400 [Erythranthe guttata]
MKVMICRDVRTREAGIQDIHHNIKPEQVQHVRRDYTANEGWETFLSYEDTHQVCYFTYLFLPPLITSAFCTDVVKENCKLNSWK